MAAQFNLNQLHGFPLTPMISEPLTPNNRVADQASIHLYQRKVGSIIYNAVISRLDVACAAAVLSSFLANPSNAHMATAN
jgi:hypothetical protein